MDVPAFQEVYHDPFEVFPEEAEPFPESFFPHPLHHVPAFPPLLSPEVGSW